MVDGEQFRCQKKFISVSIHYNSLS
jgi:hypothetical protein